MPLSGANWPSCAFVFRLTIFVRIPWSEGRDLACFWLEAMAEDAPNIVTQQVEGDGGLIASGRDSMNVTGWGD